jgi:RNA polymerase sigma-70 factor, ECF subfamily
MSESSLSTSTLARAVAGERTAWKRLFDLYWPLLYARCRRSGLQDQDAADVAQEVLLAALKSVGNFRRENTQSSFCGWLLGITAYKLKDYWDRKAKNPQGEGGSEAQRWIDQLAGAGDESSTTAAVAEEKTALLRRALQLIQGNHEERTWKAFWRFEIDGQPAAAVAGELGMTPNAVHVAVCRVKKQLREEFADLL